MMWRRLDNPGHEWARLSGTVTGPVLRGTAIFMEDKVLGRLDYKILCDSRWVTQSVRVLGWVGDAMIKLSLERRADESWWANGQPVARVAGCSDIDLSFSPSTNLLPIRRLDLEIGQQAEAKAAWLRFPDLDLHPLVQRFHRVSENHYFYASENGFSAKLEVDADGFVRDYPPLWTVETG